MRRVKCTRKMIVVADIMGSITKSSTKKDRRDTAGIAAAEATDVMVITA
jgi:hypothetical protein